jgi:AAA+ superfamily predicted ATPase
MKEHRPVMNIPPGPYESNGAHLRDELARVDLLVRAQIVRWRQTIGAHKPEALWGMMHVTDAEIAHYLDAPVTPPDSIPDELRGELERFWRTESETAERIEVKVKQIAPSVDLRLPRLCTTFDLNDAERNVVLLCLLPEIDLRYRRIFGYLQDDASRSHPTVALVSEIVLHFVQSFEEARALFEPRSSLLRNHIVALAASPDESWSSRFLRLDDRIVAFLLGSDEPDIRLEGIVSELAGEVAWSDLLVDSALRERLRDFAAEAVGKVSTVVLHGPYGVGKERAARAICTHRRVSLLRFDVEAALEDPPRWGQRIDLAYREAGLRQAALYVDGIHRLQEDEQPAYPWKQLVRAAESFSGTTFLVSEAPGDRSRKFRDSQLVRFEFPVPHHELRRKIWRAVLPEDASLPHRDALTDALAASFQITEGMVRDAVTSALAAARRRSFKNPRITPDDLYEACRKQAGRRLLGFARRIEPTRHLTIDDVILTDPIKTQLRELLDRVRLRSKIEAEMKFEKKVALGNGLVVLFAGPSGTGKTLSAEVIANQQGVDLYKVDASAIVSKWVGETEKNLSRVFAEAEDSDALLFFDECDALFGQRGEVASEASGRWANLQVNYLLQRIEEYSGVVILATNLRKNIDEAFTRRIHLIVEFATPDSAMRFQIWKRTLPASSAVSDAELLAISDRFALTGGSMQNASVDAAFRALGAERTAITVRDLLDSIAREYQKLGKPITQGEFGAEFYGWAVRDILSPVRAG